MRIASVALAVVPILSLAHTDLEKVVAMIPTMEELNQTYPDIVFESTDNPTSSRDVVSGEIAERNIGYKFVAGGLSAVGYYAFGGGCDQVDKAYAACTDSQGSNFQCVNRAAGAATAHIMIGGAGFVGGREFIMYFWHGGALQAAGLPQNQKVKRACNANQRSFASSTHFSGPYGMKVAGKDFCYRPDAGQLGYVTSLAQQITSGMNRAGQCSLNTQYTIYRTSSRQVLGRFHLQLESVKSDVCPFPISGGDSCTT